MKVGDRVRFISTQFDDIETSLFYGREGVVVEIMSEDGWIRTLMDVTIEEDGIDPQWLCLPSELVLIQGG